MGRVTATHKCLKRRFSGLSDKLPLKRAWPQPGLWQDLRPPELSDFFWVLFARDPICRAPAKEPRHKPGFCKSRLSGDGGGMTNPDGVKGRVPKGPADEQSYGLVDFIPWGVWTPSTRP